MRFSGEQVIPQGGQQVIIDDNANSRLQAPIRAEYGRGVSEEEKGLYTNILGPKNVFSIEAHT